jgi:hypothetical protein
MGGKGEEKSKNAHFVLYYGLGVVVTFVPDLDIEIAVVPRVWRAGEVADDGLTFGNGQGCWGVEHRLPVGYSRNEEGGMTSG